MIDPDLGGARPSNAGDEFHELWALRRALALLDHESPLRAVAVEGLRREDETGTDPAIWEGVDCAFYFGGDTLDTATRIEIAQLKYSTADPGKAWTVARLCEATNKKRDNAVIARLAAAFAEIRRKRPELVPGISLVVRLVSNQPVDPAVKDALAGAPGTEHQRLRSASKLKPSTFKDFAAALELPQTGEAPRYALDDAVVAAIAAFTEADARNSRNELMRWLRTRMVMPDRPRDPITRSDLLIQLAGSANPAVLFPCEPALVRTVDSIPRAAAEVVIQRMLAGAQKLVLIGEGGCGKTTALFQIEAGLPAGSAMVVYDCYGAGRYLDSDAERHQPRHAFLQITNDLARQLRSPFLIPGLTQRIEPSTFNRRLELNARLIASRDPQALLVIAIDAADNAVIAAEEYPHGGPSFVREFARLGDLPANVRLLVTARPGRQATLDLPLKFERLDIGPFTTEESRAYLKQRWPAAPATWIEDLHALSGGNPRVQAYALDQAGSEVERAIDILRPDGKRLEVIFNESFEAALSKAGRHQDVATLCAALIALPRPVPVRHLGDVTGLGAAQIRDLVADLRTGGLRLDGDAVGFADEDLEAFVRGKAGEALPQMLARIAGLLHARRADDAYAATHVAVALLKAGRRAEIMALTGDETWRRVVSDPVQQRAVQLQRLRIGMKVCREAGDLVDAAQMILAGAEAVRTNAALMALLDEHPELAVRFAPDNVSQILRDPESLPLYGSYLMHRMAEDARAGDAVAVREGLRQLRAWQKRHEDTYSDADPQQLWSPSMEDHAAVAEAICRTDGPAALQRRLRHWSYSSLLTLALVTSRRTAAAGDVSLLADWLASAPPPRSFRFIPLTHLALTGHAIDIEMLLCSLERGIQVGVIDLEKMGRDRHGDGLDAELHELFVTGCEIAIHRGVPAERVRALLDRLRPLSLRQRRQAVNVDPLALAIRAHALCEAIDGRSQAADSFLVDPPDSEASKFDARSEIVELLVKAVMRVFSTRAHVLLGTARLADLRLPSAADSYRLDPFDRSHVLGRLCSRTAVALARLCHVSGYAAPELAQHVLACAKAAPFGPLYAETLHLAALALRPEWHDTVLDEVTRRSTAILELRATASDKSGALLRLAQILAPVSAADAGALFADAIAAAGEADRDLVPALKTLSRVIAGLGGSEHRDIALKLIVAAGDIGVRLGGEMPWEQVIEALVRLDPCLALAALARWDDESIVHRRENLTAALTTGLRTGALTAERAAALTALMEHTAPDLIAAIVTAARRSRPEQRRALAEELARDECLFHGKGARDEVLHSLQDLAGPTTADSWVGALRELVQVHQTWLPKAPLPSSTSELPEAPDVLASINWRSARWITADSIDSELDRLLAQRAPGARYSAGDVLDRMAAVVAVGDRTAHLAAMAALRTEHLSDRERCRVLLRRLDQWRTPAIDRWRRDCLLQVIRDGLPSYCVGLIHGGRQLAELLKATEAGAAEISDALLDGIERHVERFDAPTLYALLGVIAEYAPREVAIGIARGFAARLVATIPAAQRSSIAGDDLPKEPAEAIARFLYALMSDVEVPLRWRAAHAVRRLARLGDTNVIDTLVALLDRREEATFRAADAPFYWLSARLWLLIALDRVASEAPQVLIPHAQRLLAAATDETLPHVLIRAFAAAAVQKLIQQGLYKPSPEQASALAAVNAPRLSAISPPKGFHRGFGHLPFEVLRARRYSFDAMDTVPYWYGPASKPFADVDSDTFLNIAEGYILDQWSEDGVERAWDRQPRRDRMIREDYSSSHRQGVLPSLERWDTHLEWHAMYCTVGLLLRTHALAEPGKFDELDDDLFDGWLSREGLTHPPEWLSDRLAPIPAEPALWRAPANPDAWLAEITDEALDALIGLDTEDSLAVAGKWHGSSSRISWTAQVMSALVPPHEVALLASLSSLPSRHDYSVPAEDETPQFDDPSRRLSGWLRRSRADLRLDTHDPLRNGISNDAYVPGSEVQQVLGLTRSIVVGRPTWQCADGSDGFVSESWGDLAGDQDARRITLRDVLSTDGYRLWVARPALLAFLKASNRDLLVEVTLIRRRVANRQQLHDDGSRHERTRLYLLRPDGTIQTVEGEAGTWIASP